MLRLIGCLLIMVILTCGLGLAQDEAAPIRTVSLAVVALQAENGSLAISSGEYGNLLQRQLSQPVMFNGEAVQFKPFFLHTRSPIFQRALVTGNVTQSDWDRITEPRRAVKLGIAVGADYVLVPRVISCSALTEESGTCKGAAGLGLTLVEVASNTDPYTQVPLSDITLAFTGIAIADSGLEAALTEEAAARAAVRNAATKLLSQVIVLAEPVATATPEE